MVRKLQIWRDRRGKLSWLRAAALAFLLMPVAIALSNADAIAHGAPPLNDVIHRPGLWPLLFILATLAATSTAAMVRRLGALRWQRLHYAVYGIGALALIHYFQQTKADVSVPTFTAGVFAWLMGYRIVVKLWKVRGELSTPTLVGLSVAGASLTFISEAVGIGLVFNAPPLLVLHATLDF